MRYTELCEQMGKAGWLSHTVAACNTNHRKGSGLKHFTAKMLLATRTGQAFQASQPVPKFNSAGAVNAVIHYNDEHGRLEESVLIDHTNGLLFGIDRNPKMIAYLDDIPSDHITYTSTPSSSKSLIPDLPVPDIDEYANSAREGAVSFRLHLVRERNPRIIADKRKQVLAATGRLACSVCKFDFQKFYGTEFCEVHHLRPLANAKGETVTELVDLAVVCSNCHRMIHQSNPFLTIEQLKSKIQRVKNFR
jgi:predicted HNH restriction endonuclease